MSLRRNLARSRYGCHTRDPRRFCSLAFQFRMQPLMRGAKARSRMVCNRMDNAVMGGREVESKVQSPKSKVPSPKV